jgi:hypothetical protein
MERCSYCHRGGKITNKLCEYCNDQRDKRQVCSNFIMMGMIMSYTKCECNYLPKKCKQCRDSINANGCGKCFICQVEAIISS